ncbi:hypothetical protein K9B33_20840 [Sphingobium sp. 3R8]|uniref:lysozyme n=1 Tax=Sphingobium sp. 3R8 TaxID=2874921 RepID=UPI001CCAD290|nr:hypothetical protein [Sphingobium sp. 3R8]MBZ9649985.1 hypothetical protein [Sphingobium sp. 3R8]
MTEKITRRTALELIGHEAIVLEWYKDSKGIGTWGIGVTSASGHNVERYKDKPQTVARCIEIFLWLLETKYAPDVRAAFRTELTEAQFAAALSFHYNTGAIKTASWVRLFNEGKVTAARSNFMSWRYPAEILSRREKECRLFFDGKWSNDGKVIIYPVLKPSYQPAFRKASRVDITHDLGDLP